MKNLYRLLIYVCILSVSHFNAFAQNVNFPDPNLAAAVRSKLDLAEGADIPKTRLEEITSLSKNNAGITNLTGLEHATNLKALTLNYNQIEDIKPLQDLTLNYLSIRDNPISDFTPLGNLTSLTQLNLINTGFSNSDISILSPLVNLEELHLDENEISDLQALVDVISNNMPNLENLQISANQFSNITPLTALKDQLTNLNLNYIQISNFDPLAKLTNLTRLNLQRTGIRDLRPLENLTKLTSLIIGENPYTDISPLAALTNLTFLYINNTFETEVTEMFPNIFLRFSEPLPAPPSEPETEAEAEPEPESAVKQRRIIARCGLGWSPHSQYQHHGELPKVMIYALEFEYDPASHGRYICKTIEIRTGDDSIENLAGWNLYLGTLYNPSRIPLKIPEEPSQITDRILRITPEMLGLETFPCNTVNGISHPLPGVQYVLKTDENVLIDTAYSCFVWGQNAYTTVNDKNVESPRRISSAALREMEAPRLERYVTNPTGIFITYIPFEDFAWDRAVLSDWLLASSEETVAAGPNAPFLPDKKLTTTWGAIKKPPALRQSNFKHKPAR